MEDVGIDKKIICFTFINIKIRQIFTDKIHHIFYARFSYSDLIQINAQGLKYNVNNLKSPNFTVQIFVSKFLSSSIKSPPIFCMSK